MPMPQSAYSTQSHCLCGFGLDSTDASRQGGSDNGIQAQTGHVVQLPASGVAQPKH